MKSRTLIPILQQPHQITKSQINSPLTFETNTPSKSRLMDSFNFMMGLIEAEPFSFIKNTQSGTKSSEQINNRDQWQTIYYQDDYAVGEC